MIGHYGSCCSFLGRSFSPMHNNGTQYARVRKNLPALQSQRAIYLLLAMRAIVSGLREGPNDASQIPQHHWHHHWGQRFLRFTR
jgi:hypothetical protein